MKGVRGEARVKINVKRSEFIATAKRVDSVEEAKDFISRMKKKFRDASHNSWAYRVYEGKVIEHSSDDGEPSGTAGLPILSEIKRMDLVNVAVVVTRYFGGVKLGVRGLREAYGKAAEEVLKKMEKVELKVLPVYELETSYEDYGKVKSELSRIGAKILREEFEDKVRVIFASDGYLDNAVKIGEKLFEWW